MIVAHASDLPHGAHGVFSPADPACDVAEQQGASPGNEGQRVPLEQQQQLQTLCQRLGREESDWQSRHQGQAEQRPVALQIEEDKFVLATEDERCQETSSACSSPLAPPGEEIAHIPATPLPETLVNQAMLRHLKHRWRTLFRPGGDPVAQREAWKTFKFEICGEEVSDGAMNEEQYEQLVLALDQSTRR